MTETMNVSLIGCGNISTAYLGRSLAFRGLRFTTVADANPEAAAARAAEYGVAAASVEALLADPAIDVVVNLTIPTAHYAVSKAALQAGKHVYSEKPYVLSMEEGRDLAALASRNGLRIGSAPDTILGASHQLARHLVDSGAAGRITSGTCFMMGHGMEDWHPNPGFFYQPGGGPMLDLGPYYVANLVQLLGPVRRVGAMSATPEATRRIGSGQRAGEVFPVGTPTTIHGLLEFHSGAVVTLVTSWDVWQHDLPHMALYGSEGTIHIPDPNFFDGAVRLIRRAEPVPLPPWDHPLGPTNREVPGGRVADYRSAGLADMVQAIAGGRPHRCNDSFALHVVETLSALVSAGQGGRFIDLATTCTRPEPLGPAEARALLA